MSTKTKASSKNKKATPKKALKKAAPKKAVAKKKAVKPSRPAVAKKAVVKKAASKSKPSRPVASKKAVPAKKQVKSADKKKASKPVAPKKTVKVVKKAAPKKAVKKVVVKATAAKARKVVAKKATPKKAAKVAVKKQVKKITAKKVAAVKKPVVKPVKISKPIPVKAQKPEPKEAVVKPVKVAKVKPVVVKKPIVAPTTFRQEDTGPVKFIKEPNGKFEMEFVIRASEDMVFEFVSTESGLSEWFCDDVTIRNGVFTFTWDGQEQQAKLVKEIPPTYIRYQWLDKNDGSYFEFRTQKDELTNDISLIITDFASDKSDEESARLLWDSQVHKLLHVLGSFF